MRIRVLPSFVLAAVVLAAASGAAHAQPRTLTIAYGGTASGSTTPAAGVHLYPDGYNVIVTANTEEGSFFGGWEGDAYGSELNLELNMNANKSITALFYPEGHRLTVHSTGLGNTNPLSGSTYYLAEGVYGVVHTYATDPTWRFDHWEGDYGDMNPAYATLIVPMDQDRDVTAVFIEKPLYTLTMALEGNGATTPAPGVYQYREYDFLSVSAVPDAGWRFSHWEGDYGDNLPTSPQLSLSMSQNRALTAHFVERPERTLTINTVGNGTTDPAAGVHTYLDLEVVVLTATPDLGWRFDHWEGDIVTLHPENPSLSLTLDADKTVTAVFAEYDHVLTVEATGDGTTTPAPGAYGQAEGASVWIYAWPGPGQAFDHWEGDIGAANPLEPSLNVVMTSDRLVRAVFAPGDWSLTLQHVGLGTGRTAPYDPGVYWFLDGRSVHLDALPDAGSFFGGWEDDVADYLPSIDFVINSDMLVSTRFESAGFALTLSVSGQGGTEPTAGTFPYASGITLNLSARDLYPGWAFDHWTGDIGAADPASRDIAVLMDRNRAVQAVFVERPVRTLTLGVTGNGSTNLPPGTYEYTDGQLVFLSATADAGSQFDHWEGDVGTGDPNLPSLQVTMDQDRAITAVFRLEGYHTLTLAIVGSGTANLAEGPHDYLEGTWVTLQATASTGWVFDRWEGDLGGASPNTIVISVQMDQDRSITLYFRTISMYTLTLSVVGNGVTQPAAGPHSYPVGRVMTVLALPRPGWSFDHWEGDFAAADPSSASIVITMDQDRLLTAYFTEIVVPQHAADTNRDDAIDLSELLRVIQFFNSNGLHCAAGTEDGYDPGPGDATCTPHSSDYNPQDWHIDLSELLRVIQFFNSAGYHVCAEGEDGFCPGPA